MRDRHNKRAVSPGQGYIGVVKNWIQDRGFGFISMGVRNIFVHTTQIVDAEELEIGETVYFELQEDDKGRLSAKHVTTHFDNLNMPPQVQYVQGPHFDNLNMPPQVQYVQGPHFDNLNMPPQVQYVQGPTGQIFAVPINPVQQHLMIQRYNEMVMVQNQASLQRHSPQLQALNSVVSEVPTLAPELPGLNSGNKPDGEVKPTTKPETQAATQMSLQQLQAQHLHRLQMFQLAAQQQHLQSQRVVLFPMSLAQNVMLNQPATVLPPPGLIQTRPNVPATKKTNHHGQQKTNQEPVSQAGAIHSFYKAFKPY